MTRRLQPPAAGKLADKDAERARQNHADRIRELQGIPIVGGKVIEGIELAAGVTTPVAHGLGRRARVLLSPPRGGHAVLVVPAAAMTPVASSNWFHPNGTQDYWLSDAATQLIHAPLTGLMVGTRVVGMQLSFFAAAAANPTIGFYGAAGGASGGLVTPTVAWTAPGTAAWEQLTAEYDQVITAANWYVTISCPTSGDRVRGLYVTVESGAPAVEEVRSASHDPSRYFVLRSSTECTVDAWCF